MWAAVDGDDEGAFGGGGGGGGRTGGGIAAEDEMGDGLLQKLGLDVRLG